MSDNRNELKNTQGTIPAYLDTPAAMPVPLDMSDIYQWEHKIDDIAMVNSFNGPLYIKEFLKAKELASSYHSLLILEYEKAKNETKKQQALAYLERSLDYIKEKGLKETDETKKQYVFIDAEYREAKNIEDMYKALITLIGNKVDKFQNAYEASKKIFEMTKDPSGARTALPSWKDEA